MDPITIASLAASAIPGIAKLFGGGSQVREAKKLAASNTFTPYQTPEQILEATQLAENEFRNGMPGMTSALSNLGGSSAAAFDRGLSGATSGADVLNLATNINANENQGLNALNDQALNYRNTSLGNYSNALGTEAGYADKEYQINKLDPYNRKANLAASMYGAGKTNQFSGLDSLATSALAGATAYQNYKKQGK